MIMSNKDSTTIKRTNTNISQCDISAIEEANSSPHAPSLQFLGC
jgi:hypothetical protein